MLIVMLAVFEFQSLRWRLICKLKKTFYCGYDDVSSRPTVDAILGIRCLLIVCDVELTLYKLKTKYLSSVVK